MNDVVPGLSAANQLPDLQSLPSDGHAWKPGGFGFSFAVAGRSFGCPGIVHVPARLSVALAAPPVARSASVPASTYVASKPLFAITVVGSETSIESTRVAPALCESQPAQHHLPANVLVCSRSRGEHGRLVDECVRDGLPVGDQPVQAGDASGCRRARAERVLHEREARPGSSGGTRRGSACCRCGSSSEVSSRDEARRRRAGSRHGVRPVRRS